MNKYNWAVIGTVLLVTIGLFAVTRNQLFGVRPPKAAVAAESHAGHEDALGIDSILIQARQKLTPDQRARILLMENSVSRGDVHNQQLHLFHQLAGFWRDSARVWEPYAWYTAEAARLENSENSLNFAGRKFLDRLRTEENPALRQWEASQGKDLLERSLKLNGSNDSIRVDLASVIVYGGVGSPMEGISLLQEVVKRNPDNAYALKTLGEASLMSGQTDKAIERFKHVVQLEPGNVQVILMLADIYERKGDKSNAIDWYQRSLPLAGKIPGLTAEVEQRIAQLKK